MHRTLMLLALAAAPLAAQDHAEHKMSKHVDPVTSIKPLQDQFLGFITKAAEQMPEADFAYAPTTGVRTFGQLLGHVANANFMFCATVKGEKSPATVNYESLATNKAALIEGLKAAAAYCGTTWEAGAKKHHDPVDLFGMKGDVTWALAFNVAHNAEHYGNLVTYIRMKGMVPPSSQQN